MGPEAHPTTYKMGTWGFLPGDNLAGSDI